MKKDSRGQKSPRRTGPAARAKSMVIGIDLGDKSSRYCVLEEGEAVEERSVATTKQGLTQAFAARGRCRIALAVGPPSPWASRLFTSLAPRGSVPNPRH